MTSRPGSPIRHDISSESGVNVPTSPDRDPPGIEQGQGQTPLIEPQVPTTISADNFKLMMDYWRVQADKQEERITKLLEKLAEKDKEKDKNPDTPKKLPSIDIKDVKKPDEYDGDEKQFFLWYPRFKNLLSNRHAG